MRDSRNWVAHNIDRATFDAEVKSGRVTQLVEWLGLESMLSRIESINSSARNEFTACVGLLLLELGIETAKATPPHHRSDRGRLFGVLAGDRDSLLSFVEGLASLAATMKDSPQGGGDTDPGATGPDPVEPER